ncbi:MAG: class I SAM-dependent methyltransferase [Promethearchaeota archaeon]
MLKKGFNEWKNLYIVKNKYCTRNRYVFYDIAAKYLPSNENSTILDIGAGDGEFINHLSLEKKYERVFLLDMNKETIEDLKKRFKNVILYNAPEKLPFENASVDLIHCSHMIEHLYYQDLYQFLKEVNRVLEKGGIFIISTPLLSHNFYNNLTHIKPYEPEIFINYLCVKKRNQTGETISQDYTSLELVYRYTTLEDYDEGWGSNSKLVDFLIHIAKMVLSKLKIKNYTKNGYTIVLKKNS